MPDQGEKTQQPTPQRLQKTRREGRFPISRDFISSLQFLTFVILAFQIFDQTAVGVERLFKNLIEAASSTQDLDPLAINTLYHQLIFPFFAKLLLPGLGLAVVVAFVQLATTRFGFATQQLIPDFKRLNSLPKIQQLPKDNAVNFFRSIVLMTVIFFLVYALIRQQMGELTSLAAASLPAGLSIAAVLLKRLVRELAFVLLLFGLVDFVRQRAKFQKSMKMTKQEVKEDQKNVEGNMQMKMRIRRLQRDAIRRNMIKSVEKASVVIVNPTHYAIAIHYQMGTRTVPVVVAKGKNYLARIIRERAKQHEVPIVENKPLAQALYQAVNVGDEIPSNLYRAVAEVLGQIYRILNRQ